jgi:phage gp29-like protein
MTPKKQEIRELILPVWTQVSKVPLAEGALSNLTNGDFYDAALLLDQIFRDDRIRAVWDIRVNSVLGAPQHFEPGKDTAMGRRVADDADASWWDMVPRSELALLYRWGICLGVGVAHRGWVKKSGSWTPSLKTWHPGALWYSVAEDVYYLRHEAGQIAILPDDPNWVLFTPYGFKYARQQGLIYALTELYLDRRWTFRDRARHSEIHGQPIRQGIAPADAAPDEVKSYKRAIANAGSESVVITKQGQEGNRWDLKLIESQSTSSEVFTDKKISIDEDIAILFLGQSMSTTGQGGLGSQEKAGDSVRGDVKRFDASTIGDLSECILAPWARYDYGSEDLTPRLVLEVDPPEDEAKKAQTLNALGDAIGKLEKYGLDTRTVLEEAGVPLLSEAEAEARRQQLVIEAQEAMQGAKADAEKQPPTDDAWSEDADETDEDDAAE